MFINDELFYKNYTHNKNIYIIKNKQLELISQESIIDRLNYYKIEFLKQYYDVKEIL